MNASKLIQFIRTAIVGNWPLLLEGSPGIGKTDCIEKACADENVPCIVFHPVVSDPTDFKGLPAVVNGEAKFLPFGDLLNLTNAKKKTVCFFDDLGQAPQSVQAAAMQLILARKLNGISISPHVVFMAATNRRQDAAGVAGIITPLRSRFNASIELTIEISDWIKWGLSNNIPAELLGFINFRPKMLNTFDPKTAKDGKPFACPRTVAKLGEMVAKGITDTEVFAGCVGEGFAAEFSGFLAIWRTVSGLPQQVILNPKTAGIPDAPDVQFALAAALSYQASDKNIDAIQQYYERTEQSGEMRTFFWKASTSRNPKLQETNAHNKWALAHSDEIR